MRISLTGAAGIGKTTLARALSEELGLPLLAENLRPVVDVLGQGSPMDERARAAARDACRHWLQRRAAEYLAHPSFVEDRCALDVLLRWLRAGLTDRDNAGTRELVAQVRALLDAAGYLVILPLVETEEVRNHDGMARAGSSGRLIMAHATTIGLAIQYVPPDRLIMVPVECTDLAARLQFVRETIG